MAVLWFGVVLLLCVLASDEPREGRRMSFEQARREMARYIGQRSREEAKRLNDEAEALLRCGFKPRELVCLASVDQSKPAQVVPLSFTEQ